MEKILIIGGVAAGATAAAKARRISPTAQITILEAGPDISFANCGLPYHISKDIDSRAKLILQSPESFKNQYNIDVFTNTQATSIDRKNKTVTSINTKTNAEQKWEYTKLILAQGGNPVQPPIPGADAPHVFKLWTLRDMDKIIEFIDKHNPRTACVIGGGFIGIEMVEALAKRKIKIHLVEAMPHILFHTDPEIAAFAENEIIAHGVQIHKNKSVTAINAQTIQLSDNTSFDAQLVLLSIGVKPNIELAQKAGLEIGKTQALHVDEYLKTSDPDIYATGDMIEIEHAILNKKVRIPLAGPANRQGRMAAENALGAQIPYKGSIGTSILKIFDAIIASTGLSLKQAINAQIDAISVTVHKEHHTSYYPGAQTLTVKLIVDKTTKTILGAQAAGFADVARRIDVLALACAHKLTIDNLAVTDFAYSPPLGTPNDILNMTAFVAQNRLSNFSPSIATDELDKFVETNNPLIIDLRDDFAIQKSSIQQAIHIPIDILQQNIDEIKNKAQKRPLLLIDETGKLAHRALRALKNFDLTNTFVLSGGFTSLARHAQAIGFKNLNIKLQPIEPKSIEENTNKTPTPQSSKAPEPKPAAIDTSKPLIVDVRTPREFATGAYPGALNIPLDEIEDRIAEFGTDKSRKIIVYCASGARSSYAQNYLKKMGFKDVTNGGGVSQMMRNRPL